MEEGLGKVLLLTAQANIFDVIQSALVSTHQVVQTLEYSEAKDIFEEGPLDFAFIDIEYFKESLDLGKDALKAKVQVLKKIKPDTPLIILASVENTRSAVQVVRNGADEYLNYPLEATEINYILDSISEQTRMEEELGFLREEIQLGDSDHLVQTRSLKMKEVFKSLNSVAPTKTTVLLLGESGTGKGVFSHLIHNQSNRKDGPFISIHCGAIPDNLVESELFGHEKGSFTGAIKQKLGKFELAKGGTIFLDEIGTIEKSIQIKLLKVLQEKIFQRVGGESDIEADVRIIAATNEDLKDISEKGVFRQDLFYRLNVFPITMPPLRERLEDIPILVEGFIKLLNERDQKEIEGIDPRVLDAFRQYNWPGNIRELENLIERGHILETSNILTPESFPSELFNIGDNQAPQVLVDTQKTLASARSNALEAVERNYLKTVLEKTKGKIGEAAELAGISSRQFHKLLTRHGIRKEEYKKKGSELPEAVSE